MLRFFSFFRLAITWGFLSYCAALSLLGPGLLFLWYWAKVPHVAVAVMICSGIALGPFIFFRAGDRAALSLASLPAAAPGDIMMTQQALAKRRLGRLTIRTSARHGLDSPTQQALVIRTMRNTMIVVPPQNDPSQTVRTLDSGRGWILPWVMTVVAMPSSYVSAIAQIIGYRPDSSVAWRLWFKRLIPLIILALYAVPSIVISWFVSQLAMLTIGPRVLARYLSLTGKYPLDCRFSLRTRLLLPFTWEQEKDTSAMAAAPAYVKVAASALLVMSVNLVASPVVDGLVWWDEKPVVATVEEVTHVGKKDFEVRFFPDSSHPIQGLTVALPDSTTTHVTSSADTFTPGDSILLAESTSEVFRAVPKYSAFYHFWQVAMGMLWTLLGVFVFTFVDLKRSRKLIWLNPEELTEHYNEQSRNRRT